jgi:predicted dehydrogenase
MEFSAGQAAFTCSTQLTPYQRVNIFGTEGRIEIKIPFNAPEKTPTSIYYEVNDTIEEIVIEVCNHYQAQAELFSKAVLEGTPVPTPPEDAIANMKVIDAMFRSEQSGTWERV